MPIDYTVNDGARLIEARAWGVLTDGEIFEYQEEVFASVERRVYDEIFDLSGIIRLDYSGDERIAELAEAASSMDDPAQRPRLAIVAAQEPAHTLADAYRKAREAQASSKKVEVFRTMEQARSWLNV